MNNRREFTGLSQKSLDFVCPTPNAIYVFNYPYENLRTPRIKTLQVSKRHTTAY